MSFPYPQDRRRRIGPGTGFSASGRRTLMGYWVPLALTVSIATIGIAAWVWSERNDEDDEDDDYHGDDDYGETEDERPIPPGSVQPPGSIPGGYPGYPVEPGAGFVAPTADDIREISEHDDDDSGMLSRMQGALRRTPSPQELFDGASKRVAAGVAAAGAFMGLAPIREEGRGDFEDHTRWSEEVESRAYERDQQAAVDEPPVMSGALPSRGATPLQPVPKKQNKKTVAIVVSSIAHQSEPDDFDSGHASILSHLPEHVDPDTSKIFVLIYAPDLKHTIGQGNSSNPTLSIASSYSNMAREEAESGSEPTSGTESRQAGELEAASPFFRDLYSQAQTLVEKNTMIMPFNTPTGHLHLVRHLSPDLVYIQESLTGNEGSIVHHLSGWVRQVIVVVGDDGGRAGLVDSEDESALADSGEKWWQREGVTGIGKRIDVIDAVRIGNDWQRRVRGHD